MKKFSHALCVGIGWVMIVSNANAEPLLDSTQYIEHTVGAFGVYNLTLEPRAMREVDNLKGGFGGGLRYRYLKRESTLRFALEGDYTSISGISSAPDSADLAWKNFRIAPSIEYGFFGDNFAPHLGLDVPFSVISEKSTKRTTDNSYVRIGLAIKGGFTIRPMWEAELNFDGAYDVVNAITRPKSESALALFRGTLGLSVYLTHVREDHRSTIIPWRAAVIGGSLGAAVTALHIYQENAWWKDDRGPFHFQDDIKWYKLVDKFGHAFGAATSSYIFDQSLQWAGFDKRTSIIGGATLGLLWETYIEVEDGFAKVWGFSPTDFYADLFGASWYATQQLVPGLENYNLKWSYWPSGEVTGGSTNVYSGTEKIAIDDYQGQNHWLVINLHGALPESLGKNIPNWLGLAIGYGARNLDRHIDNDPAKDIDLAVQQTEWYIAPDYELGKIVGKTNIGFIDFLIDGTKHFHLPQPALRVYPEVKFFLLYPVKLNLNRATNGKS